MSVTKADYSVKLTADNDSIVLPMNLLQLIFDGSGLTAGQRFSCQTPDGSEIFVHTIVAANDNYEANFADNYWVRGLKIPTTGVTGTWTLTAVIG